MSKIYLKIFILILFVLAPFFIFKKTDVSAQTSGCQVLSGTKFRPVGTINNYNENSAPYVYIDVKTSGCANTVLRFKIETMDFSLSYIGGSTFALPNGNIIDLDSFTVGFSNNNSNVDFWSPNNDFSVPILLGETGVLGSCSYNCDIRVKVYDLIAPTIEIYNFPGPGFECDDFCNLPTIIGGPPCLSGATPRELLGYEAICVGYDNSTINVTSPGSSSQSSTGGGTFQYSETPLAPLPGFTGDVDLGGFLEALFTILIVIAGILALIMIIVGGLTYITTDAFAKKEDGRMYIMNALTGLVLALGAWVILNTINPNLASDLGISIPTVSIDGNVYSAPGVASIPSGCGPKPPYNPPVCANCQEIGGGINLKPGNPGPATQGYNTINANMLLKLYNLQNSLSSSGIEWWITEAFNPTYSSHCSQCHYNGTCIDANFTGGTNATPQNIELFVNLANTAGLRAVYETNSQNTINQIHQQTNLQPATAGGQGNYLLLNGITAPHFSVYNQ